MASGAMRQRRRDCGHQPGQRRQLGSVPKMGADETREAIES